MERKRGADHYVQSRMDTSGMRALADKCAQQMPEAPDHVARLFSIWEITRYMIPVAAGHLRRVLRNSPGLPKGRPASDEGARWFTFEEVQVLRRHLAAQGAPSKRYLPYRPEEQMATILAVAGTPGRIGRTTTALHLAVAAVLDGYRVLAVDLDATGGLTASLAGTPPGDEWSTAFALVARCYAEQLRQENRLRESRSEHPIPLDSTLSRALSISAADVVHPTRWAGLDLIGATSHLDLAQVQIPAWQMDMKSWRPWEALKIQFRSEGLLSYYDLVVLDLPTAPGPLAISGMASADILLIPATATPSGFVAVGQFLNLTGAVLGALEVRENTAADALGRPGIALNWDAVRVVLNFYQPAHQSEIATQMQSSLGSVLLPSRQEQVSLIGKGKASCIYDIDYRDFNRETYASARRGFDDTYAEIKRLITGAWEQEGTAET